MPDLPPALSDVVYKAMARDPDARFQTASEMAEALSPFADAKSARALRVIREFKSAESVNQIRIGVEAALQALGPQFAEIAVPPYSDSRQVVKDPQSSVPTVRPPASGQDGTASMNVVAKLASVHSPSEISPSSDPESASPAPKVNAIVTSMDVDLGDLGLQSGTRKAGQAATTPPSVTKKSATLPRASPNWKGRLVRSAMVIGLLGAAFALTYAVVVFLDAR
jgi:hypothetical protein